VTNDQGLMTEIKALTVPKWGMAMEEGTLVNWLVARGALTGSVGKVHSNYHIPISNTATGLLVLENRG